VTLSPQLDDLASDDKGKECPAEVTAKSCEPGHSCPFKGTQTA
jgi:hypothetical protein